MARNIKDKFLDSNAIITKTVWSQGQLWSQRKVSANIKVQDFIEEKKQHWEGKQLPNKYVSYNGQWNLKWSMKVSTKSNMTSLKNRVSMSRSWISKKIYLQVCTHFSFAYISKTMCLPDRWLTFEQHHPTTIQLTQQNNHIVIRALFQYQDKEFPTSSEWSKKHWHSSSIKHCVAWHSKLVRKRSNTRDSSYTIGREVT